MRFKDEGELPFERGILIILFGVLLPVITILVELTQHLCARELFDPFPTVGHIFVIAAVPVANGFALWALWERSGSRLDAVIFGQAVAVAVAGVYTLIFLPLTPLGVMAIPMAGIGFLPLTPILALFASVRALRRLRRAARCPGAAAAAAGARGPFGGDRRAGGAADPHRRHPGAGGAGGVGQPLGQPHRAALAAPLR
jgi:hypothetical protein